MTKLKHRCRRIVRRQRPSLAWTTGSKLSRTTARDSRLLLKAPATSLPKEQSRWLTFSSLTSRGSSWPISRELGQSPSKDQTIRDLSQLGYKSQFEVHTTCQLSHGLALGASPMPPMPSCAVDQSTGSTHRTEVGPYISDEFLSSSRLCIKYVNLT